MEGAGTGIAMTSRERLQATLDHKPVDRLCVDTQKTLPFGTPEEVYMEVRQRIDILFGDGTGFVFNAVHNILSNVPVENILAMLRAVDDARGRKSSS